jgi:Cytochrome c7 and related cytochrome c
LRIAKCKLQIAGAGRKAARVCNLQFAVSNLKSPLAFAALLAIVSYVATASSRSSDAVLFTIEQARNRSGRVGFPHDQKDHRKIVCADCHLSAREKPVNTDQPMARDFPHSACIRCHNFAAEFFKTAIGQGSRFCGICHEPRRISRSDKALRAGVFPPPEISDFEDAFSHKAHLKALPADFRIVPINNPPYGSQFRSSESPRCTDCHQQNKSENHHAKDMKTEKGHASCFVCHGGNPVEPRRVSAEAFPYANDCNVCHELDGAMRARSLFGSISGFRHGDHEIDIRPKKRGDFPISTAPDRLCRECHKPVDQIEELKAIKLPEASYCGSCHIDKKPGLPGKLSEDILKRLSRD